MIIVRKGLDKVFTKYELKILDDILPHFTRHERLNDEARYSNHFATLIITAQQVCLFTSHTI